MKPCTFMLMGLSGAGKSTLARELLRELESRQLPAELLDGDKIRGDRKIAGFSREARLKHLAAIAKESAAINLAGKHVVGAFILPYEEARAHFRQVCPGYVEIWISTPLDVCEKRDVKGLYAKARQGLVTHFTGIHDPFENPTCADVVIDTTNKSVGESAQDLWNELQSFL